MLGKARKSHWHSKPFKCTKWRTKSGVILAVILWDLIISSRHINSKELRTVFGFVEFPFIDGIG